MRIEFYWNNFFLKWWLIVPLVLEKKIKTCPNRITYFPLMYFLIRFGPWMSILVRILIPCRILSIRTTPITKFLIGLLKFICGLCFRFRPLSLYLSFTHCFMHVHAHTVHSYLVFWLSYNLPLLVLHSNGWLGWDLCRFLSLFPRLSKGNWPYQRFGSLIL